MQNRPTDTATDTPHGTRLSGTERRAQIADVALRLIARDGAGRLTAARLSAEVGVSDAALFRHFASMGEIVNAAVAQFGSLLAQSLLDLPDEPAARLQAFFRHRLALIRSRPEVLQLAFNERLADVAEGDGAQLVRQHVATTRNFLFDCVQQGQRAGVLRRDVTAQALVWTIMGHMRGATHALAGLPADQVPQSTEPIWTELWSLIQENSNG